MLNHEQKKAVTHLHSPLLVLAGAGSGKTRVITEKIVYLIEQCDYRPTQICAVTFTNKAAMEMKERVAGRLPLAKRRGLKIMTFHTLGLRILKAHPTLVGRREGFSIFDAEDALQVLTGLVSQSQARDRTFLLTLQQQISNFKNALPGVVMQAGEAGLRDIYLSYQRALQAYNAVDFDDLICLPIQLFKQHHHVLEKWQKKIRYLLVDEYQDSNEAQYDLIKILMKMSTALTVVGDNFQSIYAWRGAKPQNLKQLQHDFPTLSMVKLEQNYRSTRTILAVANAIMQHQEDAFSKRLWSELGVGESVRILGCHDEQDEAEQVVADLMSHRLRFGRCYGEYAILYRSNYQARLIEKSLSHYGIGYRISGGQSWFGRTEVKDLIAYLRVMVSSENDAAFLRAMLTPRKGVGESTLEKLSIYAKDRGLSLYDCADHLALKMLIGEPQRQLLLSFKTWMESKKTALHEGKLGQVLREIVEESGYEAHVESQATSVREAQKKMSSVWELMAWIEKRAHAQRDRTLADILNTLMVLDRLERQEDTMREEVQLMTLHAAKGLEFPFVYLIGLEEENLPHHACLEGELLEEERRLFYVGMTRAKQELCLSYAKQRKRAGALQATQPSRFIDSLPQEHIVHLGGGQPVDPLVSKALATSHLEEMKTLLGL